MINKEQDEASSKAWLHGKFIEKKGKMHARFTLRKFGNLSLLNDKLTFKGKFLGLRKEVIEIPLRKIRKVSLYRNALSISYSEKPDSDEASRILFEIAERRTGFWYISKYHAEMWIKILEKRISEINP